MNRYYLLSIVVVFTVAALLIPLSQHPVPDRPVLDALRSTYAPAFEARMVAQVVDKEKLKGNPFYDRATNGDYVIFTQDRVILFNLPSGKIVDIAQLSTGF